MISLVNSIFDLAYLVLLAWVIMSWVPTLRSSTAYRAIDDFLEPILRPIRQAIPPLGGTLDISPLVLFIGLRLLNQLFIAALGMG